MKKPKTLKKKHKRTRYIPTYGFGGYGIDSNNMKSGMFSSDNYSGESGFGSFMSENSDTIGNISAGINVTKGLTAEEDWEKGYHSGMGIVSKAGPIGAIIGGVTAVGDAIGDPIRKKAESTDSSGAYNNINSAKRGRVIGSALNPFKAGMHSMSDPNATGMDKVLSWTGLGGVTAGKRLQAEESDRMEKVANANREAFAIRRRGEEFYNTPMKFANGGVFGKPQTYLGISGPQVPMSGPINPKPVGNFNYTGTELKNKLDYGQSYKRELVDDQYGNPTSLEYKMGYKYPEMSNSKIQINNKLKATGGTLSNTDFTPEEEQAVLTGFNVEKMSDKQIERAIKKLNNPTIGLGGRGVSDDIYQKNKQIEIKQQEILQKYLNSRKPIVPSSKFDGKNQYANGGQLEETRYNKDVTYYGGGYTHEDSPINGTPIGSKGLVEKDEVRYKDYIFSNRF